MLCSRELDEATVAHEIERLERVGLLDDLLLAGILVRTLHERKVLGRTAISAELRRRNLDSDAIEHFTEPRGEFTVVIEGIAPEAQPASPEEIAAGIDGMRARGASAKDAVAQIVEHYGVSRREAYRLWHEVDARNA